MRQAKTIIHGRIKLRERARDAGHAIPLEKNCIIHKGAKLNSTNELNKIIRNII